MSKGAPASGGRDIEIIDTHCHAEPWFLDPGTPTPAPDLFDNLFSECRHRGRLVASSTGRGPVLEKDGNVAAVHKLSQLISPFPEVIIGSMMVDPHDLDGALEAIEIGAGELGMRMVGEMVQYIHGYRSDGPEVLPVIQKAIDLDLPLDFHSSCEEHAEGVAHVAEKFPRAKIIIAHAAGGRAWRRGLARVRRLPNVWVEIMRGNTVQLEAAVSQVGPARITYGTDFGVHQDPALRYTAGDWLLDALEELRLPEADVDLICSGNARALMNMES